MRFDGLDLNLLVALDAILAEGTITAAAGRLNLSQSAMSSALGRLRAYFEDDLFVQAGRRTVPTSLAIELREPVRDILMRLRSAVTRREAFDPQCSTRQVSIACSDYFCRVALARALNRLEALAPRMTVEVRPIGDGAFEQMRRGELDMIFAPKSSVNRPLPQLDLYDDDFVAVAWSGHPTIRDRLTLDDFLACGHVVSRFGPEMRDGHDQQMLDALGLSRRVEVSVPEFERLPLFIVGTRRIGLLPRLMAGRLSRHMPLRVLDLPFACPRITVTMHWCAHHGDDATHTWLRGVLAGIITDVRPLQEDSQAEGATAAPSAAHA